MLDKTYGTSLGSAPDYQRLSASTLFPRILNALSFEIHVTVYECDEGLSPKHRVYLAFGVACLLSI